MTIEQRVQEILDRYTHLLNEERIIDRSKITNWKWTGIPSSLSSLKDLDYLQIDTMISLAGTNECLTSNSEYIREYKKWLTASERFT